MGKEPVITINQKTISDCGVIAWCLLFFVLINVAVGVAFGPLDIARIGQGRLLMNASDHELRNVFFSLKTDDREPVVILGNSVLWGVGIEDENDVFSGLLQSKLTEHERVVNLAVPGNSILDVFAQLEVAYSAEGLFLVFLNPIDFEAYYANQPYATQVRFPVLIEHVYADRRNWLQTCCGIIVPSQRPWLYRAAETVAFKAVPLYRYRDTIAKVLIGTEFFRAADAAFHHWPQGLMDRLFPVESNEVPERPVQEDGVGRQPYENIRESRMLSLVELLASDYVDTENVYFIILDTNRYERSERLKENYDVLLQALPAKRAFNLYGAFKPELFVNNDTVHMSTEGQKLLTDIVWSILTRDNAS